MSSATTVARGRRVAASPLLRIRRSTSSLGKKVCSIWAPAAPTWSTAPGFCSSQLVAPRCRHSPRSHARCDGTSPANEGATSGLDAARNEPADRTAMARATARGAARRPVRALAIVAPCIAHQCRSVRAPSFPRASRRAQSRPQRAISRQLQRSARPTAAMQKRGKAWPAASVRTRRSERVGGAWTCPACP